jgi:hypothetical protein
MGFLFDAAGEQNIQIGWIFARANAARLRHSADCRPRTAARLCEPKDNGMRRPRHIAGGASQQQGEANVVVTSYPDRWRPSSGFARELAR